MKVKRIKKIKNKINGEIITPYQLGKRFMLDCYNGSEEGNKTAHPSELLRKEIIEIGLSVAFGDDENVEWEVVD